ncbi:TPA: hypothetical protein DCZ36_02415 [Candidatus Gracilibacteria bacterium]|nr:hypothetical protein [Candidatus Gracilibacteria bacterium]
MHSAHIQEIESKKIVITLIPNQRIIELLRISILQFYPENERNSSKYDSEISTLFSVSFSHAVDVFSENLKNSGASEYILMDNLGVINSDFLDMVIRWVNPLKIQRNEFHNELRSCFREQILGEVLIIKNTEIRLEKGQIMLFLMGTIPKEEENSPDIVHMIETMTSETTAGILV